MTTQFAVRKNPFTTSSQVQNSLEEVGVSLPKSRNTLSVNTVASQQGAKAELWSDSAKCCKTQRMLLRIAEG